MRRRPTGTGLATAFALLSLTTLAARGDDWTQFRKDAGRTGASTDATRFPLTDVWTWSTRGFKGETPLTDVAISGERIFFIAREGKLRNLVCANAKTGTPLWRQTLTAQELPARGIPAVSGSGIVFVYDQQTGKSPPTAAQFERLKGDVTRLARLPEELGGFVIRAFDATTGRPLAMLPIEIAQLHEELPEIILDHPDPANPIPGLPIRPSGRPTPPLGSLGTPLIVGSELHATTSGPTDLYFRWSPGGLPSVVRVRHPLLGPFPDSNGPNEFWGFPPVATAGGVLVADDQKHRFMAVLGGDRYHLWHQELSNYLGVPASESGDLCVGLGAFGATRALACFHSSTGQVRWMYAPMGLTPDPQWSDRSMVAILKDVPYLKSPARPGRSSSTQDIKSMLQSALRDGFYTVRRAVLMEKLEIGSLLAPGYESNAGVVITEKQVCGEVGGSLVGLDRASGRLLWRQPLPVRTFVQSLAASSKHLFASYTHPGTVTRRTKLSESKRIRRGVEQLGYWSPKNRVDAGRHFLSAYRLEDGKLLWHQELLQPGSFALAGGLVYFANGDLTVYGPAERTYLVAADTGKPEHYLAPREPEDPDNPAEEAPPAEKQAEPSPDPERPEVTPAKPEEEKTEGVADTPKPPTSVSGPRADASILRLTYGTPLDELRGKIRERLKLFETRQVPLLLELDWLNAERGAVRSVPGGHWSPGAEEEFAALCGRLAAEAGPLYFDLAPEVNVYLRRYPERTETVLSLLDRAARAVRAAAPRCQVLVSLNVETLMGTYGLGLVKPFGELPKAQKQSEKAVEAAQTLRLAGLADAIGLTLRPQAGFRNANVLPPDYLLRVRQLLPPKPLVVTRIEVQAAARGAIVRGSQADYANRVLQCCYWLNARLVAQPDLIGWPEAAQGEDAGPKDPIRRIAEEWQEVVRWPRVRRLTAKPPQHLAEAHQPEEAVPPGR